jgi:hypothetical protein
LGIELRVQEIRAKSMFLVISVRFPSNFSLRH